MFSLNSDKKIEQCGQYSWKSVKKHFCRYVEFSPKFTPFVHCAQDFFAIYGRIGFKFSGQFNLIQALGVTFFVFSIPSNSLSFFFLKWRHRALILNKNAFAARIVIVIIFKRRLANRAIKQYYVKFVHVSWTNARNFHECN